MHFCLNAFYLQLVRKGSMARRPQQCPWWWGRRMATLISSLILLRDTMAALPQLAAALHGCRPLLLASLAATFSHAAFRDLLATVNTVLDEARTGSVLHVAWGR